MIMYRNYAEMEELMSKKKEFGEGPIYTAGNYIWWFFLGNFYFLLLNIPLIITLIALNFDPSGAAILLFLSCIPVGPAAAALLSVMGKLVRTKDTNLTRDFFKAYKTNFFQSLTLWIIEEGLLFISYYDIRFFAINTKMFMFKYFFYILIIIVFTTGLYVFPIISRFYIKSINIVKLSIYYSVRKINITFLNLCIFIIAGYLFIKVIPVIILFSISILFYIVMYLENDILKEIEDKLEPDK